MRLRVRLACDKSVMVNYNYNYHLHALIAKTVDKYNRRNPCFTFSQLYFDRYDIAREGIVNLGSCIHWYISSPHVDFLETLQEGFMHNKIIDLGGARLPIRDINILTDPEIHGLMEFSCMSPITVQIKGKGRQRFGRLGDSDFNTLLRQDLVTKYYQLHRSLPADDQLEFEFNQRYMQNRRRVSRLINYRDTKILGYMVPFLVKGNPDLIRVGYQLGFGNINDHGFGMVKVWHRLESQASEEDAVECG